MATQPDAETLAKQELDECFNHCIKLAFDPRVSATHQDDYLQQARRIKNVFTAATGKKFDAATNDIVKATEQIQEVNAQLVKTIKNLEKIQETLGLISNMIETVIKLANLAGTLFP